MAKLVLLAIALQFTTRSIEEETALDMQLIEVSNAIIANGDGDFQLSFP